MIEAVAGFNAYQKVRIVTLDKLGQRQFLDYPAEYCAFAKRVPPRLHNSIRVERDGSFVKLIWKDWQHRDNWRKAHPDVKLFEGDITPLKRVLADNPIHIGGQRRCYLDIETDSRVTPLQAIQGLARILSWAVVYSNGIAFQGCLEDDANDAETQLLFDLLSTLDAYDQICTWNGDLFDKPVIEARCKVLDVKLPRHWNWIDQLATYKRFNLQVATSGDQKTSFKLGDIAQYEVGEGKHNFKSNRTYEEWRAGGDRRRAMLDYNMQDSDLLRKIENKTNYLDMNFTIAQLCNIFPNSHSLKPTAQLDGYLLRLARKEGFRLPSRIEREETEKAVGAFVSQPTATGILKDVFVADFSSLYPSIIETFNISYDTKLTGGSDNVGGMFATGLNDVRFRTDRIGIIPRVTEEFGKLRTHWKKEKARLIAEGKVEEAKDADRRQNGFKVLRNSVYGILLSEYSRFYDKELGEAVTKAGQWLIQSISKEGENRGYRNLYNDTDGSMYDRVSYSEFVEFITFLNSEFLPSLVRERGCKINRISVDFQEAFERLIFPVNNDQPASKRYIGRFSFYQGTQVSGKVVEIKGMECKRGDSARLARKLQLEVIDKLMDGCEDPQVFEDMIEEWKTRITTDDIPLEYLVMSKSVKALDSYKTKDKHGRDKILPAQARVAKELIERGENIAPGDRVEYVVLNSLKTPMKLIPADDYKGEFCRRYIWKRTYEPSMRLLNGAFPNDRNWAHWRLKNMKKKDIPLDGQMRLL